MSIHPPHRNSYLLGLLLTIFLIYAACNQPKPVKPFFPLDEDLKAWIAEPKAGSWFVYLNQLTGEYDTMTVAYQRSAISAITPYRGEGYGTQYCCTLTPDFVTRVTTTDDAWHFTVTYPVGSAHSFTKENGTYFPEETVQILDSVEVSGVAYHKVLQTTQEAGYGPSYRKLWFAKGIGVIQKQIIRTTTDDDPLFELVDYQIQ